MLLSGLPSLLLVSVTENKGNLLRGGGIDEREIVNMFDEWNLSMRLNAGISRPWIGWLSGGI